MRAILFQAPRQIQLIDDAPEPKPGEGEVLVEDPVVARVAAPHDLEHGRTVLEALRRAAEDIDFKAVAAYEKELRHDVMAHIRAFGDAAPEARGIIHLGATSMDIEDNVDALRLRNGLGLELTALRALLADLPAGAFSLLLYHTPDLMPQAAAAGVDLYLAGHTHGGQIRLPVIGALFTNIRSWKKYERGLYHVGGTSMYVSSGIGLEGRGGPRARFLCPPEIVAIDLRFGSP